MKRKLNKAAWEALSKDVQALYKLVGDDYILQIEDEGSDDAGALRRANDRLKQERDDALKTGKEAADRLAEVTNGNARKAGDIVALEASWKQKVDDAKAEGQKTIDKLTGHLHKQLVKNVARDIAASITTDADGADMLLPHLVPRLSAELDGDEPITRVLDAHGKPSALSVGELKQEFVDNKKFSAILIGSKGSGGADGRRVNGGSGGGASTKTLEQFGKMTEADRTKLYTDDPETFKRLVDEQKASLRKF